MFKQLFARHAAPEPAERLYEEIMAQSRSPGLYSVCHVPDTIEGRFDALVLHMVLALRHLRRVGADVAVERRLGEIFVADMDQTLREMGVGDTAVARQVKDMVSAMRGRIRAYGAALDDGDRGALGLALARNVLGVPDGEAARLVEYVFAADHALGDLGHDDLLEARLSWPEATMGGEE